MATETEAKFRCESHAVLRERLRTVGARRLGRVFETNHVFDTPDRRLLHADCGLRVRACRSLDDEAGAEASTPATLAFKGPRVGGTLKAREELETGVDDPAALFKILTRLGLQPAIVYEKRREAWRLGSCEVALDELPKLGTWVEIEGPTAASVEAARGQLGLADAPLVDETYVEMAATHGELDSTGCRRLVFAGEGDSTVSSEAEC